MTCIASASIKDVVSRHYCRTRYPCSSLLYRWWENLSQQQSAKNGRFKRNAKRIFETANDMSMMCKPDWQAEAANTLPNSSLSIRLASAFILVWHDV